MTKNKIIIGIAGEMSSGKTTIADYIIKKNGGVSYRFSTPLSDIAKRIHLENSRTNLQKLSSLLRGNFGDDLLAKILYNDVKSDEHSVILVDGVRRKEDILYLETLPKFILVYVEASLEKRYERQIGRNEKIDDKTKTFEEFKKEQEHESELEIVGLKQIAQVVLNNENSIEKLYQHVDNIIKNNEA